MTEKDKATAECLLSRGVSMGTIQAATGLSMDAIRTLKDKLTNAVSLPGKLTPAR